MTKTKQKTRERALRFQYDSGYVHVFKYDPEEGDYILAVVLDPDGTVEESGQHRNGKYVELTREQSEMAREWQKTAQQKNRERTGGLHSNNDPETKPRQPSKQLESAVKAMQLYHGSTTASIRDQTKLERQARNKVRAIAKSKGMAEYDVFDQISREAIRRGPLTPIPGKDY